MANGLTVLLSATVGPVESTSSIPLNPCLAPASSLWQGGREPSPHPSGLTGSVRGRRLLLILRPLPNRVKPSEFQRLLFWSSKLAQWRLFLAQWQVEPCQLVGPAWRGLYLHLHQWLPTRPSPPHKPLPLGPSVCFALHGPEMDTFTGPCSRTESSRDLWGQWLCPPVGHRSGSAGQPCQCFKS